MKFPKQVAKSRAVEPLKEDELAPRRRVKEFHGKPVIVLSVPSPLRKGEPEKPNRKRPPPKLLTDAKIAQSIGAKLNRPQKKLGPVTLGKRAGSLEVSTRLSHTSKKTPNLPALVKPKPKRMGPPPEDEFDDDRIARDLQRETRMSTQEDVPDVDEDEDEDDDDSPGVGTRAKRLPDHAPERMVAGSKVLLTGMVSRRQRRRLRTMFGQRSDDIIELLEANETDSALTMIKRTLLQTLTDVLPIVEFNVRKTKAKGGVYQLNQVISQVRELITDIQASRDRNQLGKTLVENQIRPAFLDIAMQIRTGMHEIELSAKTKMSEKDFETFQQQSIVHTTRMLATYITQMYNEVATNLSQSLST